MYDDVLDQLLCAACHQDALARSIFRRGSNGIILDAVVWCRSCSVWFPIEDGLLEFLPRDLAYLEDRARFWGAHAGALQLLGLQPDAGQDTEGAALQRHQQEHFDWYAANTTQTYTDYADTPFWTASDALTFAPWRLEIAPGAWLLDVGCAQGRSTFHVTDLAITVVAMDVSKKMVRQALERVRREDHKARTVFFAADASTLPLKDRTFDYVLIYGVLHHLPAPAATCREVARVLKPGGVYFGQENNRTVFRFVFDAMMKLFPLWHEEAGPESMISRRMLEQSFDGSGVRVETRTGVFLPPHLVNLMSRRLAKQALEATDRVGRALPFLKDNGGIILIRAAKTVPAPSS